jgi:type IV pilus assembly protein PilC
MRGRHWSGYAKSASVADVQLRMRSLPFVFFSCRMSMRSYLVSFFFRESVVTRSSAAGLCRSLAFLLSSGLSLHQSLIIIASAKSPIVNRYLMQRLLDKLEKGMRLHAILASDRELLPPLFPEVLGISEGSGLLAEQCKKAALMYQQQESAWRELLYALCVPLISVGAAFLFLGGAVALLANVQEVPALVALFLRFVSWCGAHAEHLCLGIVLIGLCFRFVRRRFASVALLVDRLLLDIPFFGTAARLYFQAMQLQLVVALMQAGRPFEESWGVVASHMPNRYWQVQADAFLSLLNQGHALGDAVARYNGILFPYEFASAISAVCDSASLQVVALSAADACMDRLMQRSALLARLVPIALILGVACAVGGVMYTMYLPMISSFSFS